MRRAQPIHRDQWAFDFFPFPPGYEVQCNTIWALTDFTEENGATRVVPGSNLREDGLSFGPDDTEPAEMARGSVLFYSGSVYHGGGANRSDATRIGLNITYNVAWLRQEENQYLSVPREVAETLPTELLRLMGYDRGAYALGYIDDLRDPIEAVRPGIGIDRVRARVPAQRRRIGASRVRSVVRRGGRHYRGCRAGGDPSAPDDDYDELFAAFSRIVGAGEGFPQQPPLTRDDFDDYWIDHSAAVCVARFGGYLIGALLHQAQLRRPGRAHRQRGLLRAGPVPGHGGGAVAGGALAARGAAARFRRHACSTWCSSPTRPAPCTASSASRRSAGSPTPSRARTH